MRGISEERLVTLEAKCPVEQDKSLLRTLIFQCQELNPWQTIESAPKDDREILLYDGNRVMEGFWDIDSWYSEDIGQVYPTHWMQIPELPEPPK